MKNQILFPFLCALIAFTFMSCEVDIPDVDVEAPTFTFQISGPGINKTYDQDDDFSSFQLNLLENVNYTFTYTGADQGGVKKIRWQTPQDDIHTHSNLSPAGINIINLSPFSRILELEGNISNPLSGLVMNGKLKMADIPAYNSIAFKWRFFIQDFGGASGASNSTFAEMNMALVTSDQPIGEISF